MKTVQKKVQKTTWEASKTAVSDVKLKPYVSKTVCSLTREELETLRFTLLCCALHLILELFFASVLVVSNILNWYPFSLEEQTLIYEWILYMLLAQSATHVITYFSALYETLCFFLLSSLLNFSVVICDTIQIGYFSFGAPPKTRESFSHNVILIILMSINLLLNIIYTLASTVLFCQKKSYGFVRKTSYAFSAKNLRYTYDPEEE